LYTLKSELHEVLVLREKKKTLKPAAIMPVQNCAAQVTQGPQAMKEASALGILVKMNPCNEIDNWGNFSLIVKW